MQGEPVDMEQLLERIEAGAKDQAFVSIGEMLDAVGHRSYGPVVLLVGFILVTPLSGVPGMPTLMGALIFLTLGQILLGHKRIWLPSWIVGRKIPQLRLIQGIVWLRPFARGIDYLIGARLLWFVKGTGLNAMAFACMVISMGMPLTELVPFSSSIAGMVLLLFGLAMISKDGVLALIAWGILLTGPLSLFAI